MSFARPLLSCVLCLALPVVSVASAQDVFIAGVHPDRRPDNAPVVTSVDHDETWQAVALLGVSEPYPASLGFLADQGAWYTPFNHPGMTGPYDIRHWHQDK